MADVGRNNRTALLQTDLAKVEAALKAVDAGLEEANKARVAAGEAALAARRPVVALESTVISHGLPYPQNKQTALAMQDAVRAELFNYFRTGQQLVYDVAAEHGRTMDPNRLRLVGPMHIAETRAQAYENARFIVLATPARSAGVGPASR